MYIVFLDFFFTYHVYKHTGHVERVAITSVCELHQVVSADIVTVFKFQCSSHSHAELWDVQICDLVSNQACNFAVS